jgi:hypothetical protein
MIPTSSHMITNTFNTCIHCQIDFKMRRSAFALARSASWMAEHSLTSTGRSTTLAPQPLALRALEMFKCKSAVYFQVYQSHFCLNNLKSSDALARSCPATTDQPFPLEKQLQLCQLQHRNSQLDSLHENQRWIVLHLKR